MPRKRDTVDIVKALVALCTPTISISSQIDNGDGTHTLNIPNTYWLRIDKVITIDSIDYRIKSFVINESITIKPELDSDPPPSVSSFMLPKPHFLHGTTEMATIDQLQEMDPNLRTPFIYLIEPLEETNITDVELIWGREARPRLYFMDESITEWNPPTHKTNVIEPVRQMKQLFFDKIAEEEDNLYKEVLEDRSIASADWGKFVKDKGYKGKFFGDTVSGLQVDFDFTMSKTACEDITPEVICALTVDVVVTNETIQGAADGTAQSNPTGESAPANLSILWTTSDGIIPSGTETDTDLENLVGGTYTATATDSGIMGCEATDSGTVQDGPPSPDNKLLFNGVAQNVTMEETSSPLEAAWLVDFSSPDYSSLQSLGNGTFGNLNIVSSTKINVFSLANRNFTISELLPNVTYQLLITTSSVNNEGRLYIDGVESPSSPLGQLKLGRKILGTGLGGATPIEGAMNNMMQVKVLPNASQLTSIFADSKFMLTGMTSDCERAYLFDETGDDTTLIDSSADGKDGTLNNYDPPPPEYFVPA